VDMKSVWRFRNLDGRRKQMALSEAGDNKEKKNYQLSTSLAYSPTLYSFTITNQSRTSPSIILPSTSSQPLTHHQHALAPHFTERKSAAKREPHFLPRQLVQARVGRGQTGQTSWIEQSGGMVAFAGAVSWTRGRSESGRVLYTAQEARWRGARK
jgi:hypothetical protein